MNLRIRTFSMALVAMSAASQVYALPSDDSENKEKKEERNVMLNASDANKPREIQIGLPSEDVTVYENGLPAVYSSSVHKLSAHWRSDASLKGTDLMTPSESAIATGNIAYAVSSFSELGQKEFCPNSLKEETAYAILPVAMADSDGVIKSVPFSEASLRQCADSLCTEEE